MRLESIHSSVSWRDFSIYALRVIHSSSLHSFLFSFLLLLIGIGALNIPVAHPSEMDNAC